MTTGFAQFSSRRETTLEAHAFFAERWQEEPAAIGQLKQHAIDYLSRLAVPSDRLKKYRACWDAATATGGQAPLPCPQCFARHILSPLKALGSSLDSGPVVCAKCGAAFSLPVLETVA